MTVALRILDDGAWLSVNDRREVSVSELWRLDAPEFCDCELSDFLAEGFLDTAVDGRTVSVRAYGQCIVCGASGTVGPVPVGRVVNGEFRGYDRERVVLSPVETDEATNAASE